MNPDPAPTISVTSEPPDSWEALVETCGGSFFHHPAAHAVSLPPGKPVFVVVRAASDVVGVALGVARRCRLGLGRDHLYFATPPVTADATDGSPSLLRPLIDRFRARGAAEVTVDSFGLGMIDAEEGQSCSLRDRLEYLVALEPDAEEIFSAFSTSHRRNARRGEKEGWTLQTVRGAEAVDCLYAVQRTAASRGAQDGRRFRPSKLRPEVLESFAELDEPGGLALYAARDGDALLSAVLVGWGNRRAFYLQGGSTEEGYDRYSSVWLHWRIILQLREAEFRSYNLGGTPADSSDSDHPMHGLHTFKRRFGSEPVPCRGARWNLAPLHQGAHRVLGGARRALDALLDG